MNRKTVAGMMVTLLLAGMLAIALNVQSAKASGTIYIRSDGSIDPPTTPIINFANVYYVFATDISGNLVIQRDNIIVDGARYTLQGTKSGTGIDITERTNVTIQNMEIKAFVNGIRLSYSSNSNICENNIADSRYGIRCYYSFNNAFRKNDMRNTKSYGMILEGSSSNKMFGNKIVESMRAVWFFEIFLEEKLVSCKYNIVSENTIENNYDGIGFRESSNNTVSHNNITASSHNGIEISDSSCNNSISGNVVKQNNAGIKLSHSSINNGIFHNNFLDNGLQISTDGTVNIWDDGYPSGGNHWSDYTGVDLYRGPFQNETGSDGIGDAPYIIDESNQDNYPFVNPWGPVHNINTTLNYWTIQEAIDAPETLDGHTIQVSPGTYYENLNVRKQLAILGAGPALSIVNALDPDCFAGVFHVWGFDGVRISGFTIAGATGAGLGGVFLNSGDNHNISGNNINSNHYGIYVNAISRCNILTNNNMTSNYIGIATHDSAHNNITNNIIQNSTGKGLSLYSSDFNNILNNIISSSKTGGLSLRESSSNNIISGNSITANHEGIRFEESSINWVSDNNITNNYYGVYVEDSSNNMLYHNNFIHNTHQVRTVHPGSINYWDNGYPAGGNYWSDHSGTDLRCGPDQDIPGRDGIWDSPYVIDENNTDNYPLVEPYVPGNLSVSISTDKDTYHAGDTMHLGLNVTNPDSAKYLCFAIWCELPDSSKYLYMHQHSVILPIGLEYSNPFFDSIILPSLPPGNYTWHAAFLERATHTIIVEDTAEWEFS